MVFEYRNKGVCSMKTIVDIDEQHIIKDIKVLGGCDGNLKGIIALLIGTKADDAISKLRGLTCGIKNTSCPDQISYALEAAIDNLEK